MLAYGGAEAADVGEEHAGGGQIENAVGGVVVVGEGVSFQGVGAGGERRTRG